MKKGFTFWWGLTVTILISVPAIAAVIQIGHEAALIAWTNGHSVIAAIILMAIYFFIWGLLKRLEQFTSMVGNAVAGATGKIQKQLSDYRSNTRKRRTQEAIEGKRTVRGAGMAVGIMRRAHLADKGGFTPTARGQARFQAAERQMLDRTGDEMRKEDGGKAGGNDLAMEIASEAGMTAGRFRTEYVARTAEAIRQRTGRAANAQQLQQAGVEADEALAETTARFGAQLGTGAMRVAAYKSLLDSKTSYTDPSGEDGKNKWERIIEQGNELMADGLMSANDVTVAIKQRGDRADRSGVGHGSLLSQVTRSYERYQQGARRGQAADNAQTRAAYGALRTAGVDVTDEREIGRLARQGQARVAAGGTATAAEQAAAIVGNNQLVSYNESRDMNREALFGTGSAAIVTGRHETVSALAPTVLESVQEAHANYQTAMATATARGVTTEAQRDTHIAAARAARAANPAAVLTAQQQASLDWAQTEEQSMRELAATANLYDMLSQNRQNGTIMADNVMSQTIQVPMWNEATGTMTLQPQTVQGAIEARRTNPRFMEMRREYGVAAAAAGVTAPPGA